MHTSSYCVDYCNCCVVRDLSAQDNFTPLAGSFLARTQPLPWCWLEQGRTSWLLEERREWASSSQPGKGIVIVYIPVIARIPRGAQTIGQENGPDRATCFFQASEEHEAYRWS